MVMLRVILRTVATYVLLIVAMRLGGKRQIGELQLSELITALIVSEIATAPLVDLNLSLLHSVVPILTVTLLEILSTFLRTKSQTLKKLLDGRPAVLISRGNLNQKELSKARMSVEELIGECRQAGTAQISDVQYAILEENGQISVFEKAQKGETERGIAHTLVVDGNVSQAGLRDSDYTEEKLTALLKSKGLRLPEVFLCTVNDANESYVVKKKKESKTR